MLPEGKGMCWTVNPSLIFMKLHFHGTCELNRSSGGSGNVSKKEEALVQQIPDGNVVTRSSLNDREVSKVPEGRTETWHLRGSRERPEVGSQTKLQKMIRAMTGKTSPRTALKILGLPSKPFGQIWASR